MLKNENTSIKLKKSAGKIRKLDTVSSKTTGSNISMFYLRDYQPKYVE
jgi:hypothetical protein